jgi:GDP-L-fucose synthase
VVDDRLRAFWDSKRVLVTGGAGFLGSFVIERLIREGVDPDMLRIPRSHETDLRNWDQCVKAVQNIDIIIHLAARVGGIGFNQKYPATLFYENAIMGIQLMEAARRENVEKFVAVGTVCAYPKFAKVPFREEELWNGYPEETNAPYGLAKKMLLVQAQAYRRQYGMNVIYLLPVNLYGPRDSFHPDHSHVIPAIIKKMVDAKDDKSKEVALWGSGNASREFLYVEDAAEGIVMAAEKYDKPEPVNLGTGKEVTISELARIVAELTGYDGAIAWDRAKPDGQPRRCLDVTKAAHEFGFHARTSLRQGLAKTTEWYINQKQTAALP